MKILIISVHPVLEYDEIRLFEEMGHDVFSLGFYFRRIDTSNLRPPLTKTAWHESMLEDFVTCGCSQVHEPAQWKVTSAFCKNFDVIIVHHNHQFIEKNWNEIKNLCVVWRTIGQGIHWSENAMREFRQQGVKIVRWSPEERRIRGYIGEDAIIRASKSEQDYGGWIGDDRRIVTFNNDFRHRGSACSFEFHQACVADLPFDLYGLRNDDTPNWRGTLTYDHQIETLRHSRVAFVTGTNPAPYTLGFIEAWMTGTPVVHVGRAQFAKGADGVYEIDRLIEQGVSGFLAEEVGPTRELLLRLLTDDALCSAISLAGRTRALDIFGYRRAKQEWTAFFSAFSIGIQPQSRSVDRQEAERAAAAQNDTSRDPARDLAVTPIEFACESVQCTWNQIACEIPESPDAYLGAAVTLRHLGFVHEVDRVLAIAISMFPDSLELASEHASHSSRIEDWPENARRWASVRRRFPHHPNSTFGLGRALVYLGHLEEADTVLSEGMERFAADLSVARSDGWVRGLAIEHANCATSRGDWLEAARRWSALASYFNDDEALGPLIRDAQLRIAHEVAEVGVAEQSALGLEGRRSLQSAAEPLFLTFEGLGDSCEFGLVQRHFGAEPLGLLRWVTVGPDKVAEMIRSRCEGLGDPLFTTMQLSEGQEYVTFDTRYHLAMHTFIRFAGEREDKIFEKLCARLRFLARKFLEDIVSGEKIFVFRSSVTLSRSSMSNLLSAVREHNKANSLLCVTVPDDLFRAGSLIQPENGFFIGCVPCGRGNGPASGWHIEYEMWRSLCESVVEAQR